MNPRSSPQPSHPSLSHPSSHIWKQWRSWSPTIPMAPHHEEQDLHVKKDGRLGFYKLQKNPWICSLWAHRFPPASSPGAPSWVLMETVWQGAHSQNKHWKLNRTAAPGLPTSLYEAICRVMHWRHALPLAQPCIHYCRKHAARAGASPVALGQGRNQLKHFGFGERH